MDSSDPIVASYDVYLTDSQISRFVLQYLDRSTGRPYDERHDQKPTSFRLKPKTGLVEVDVPISTQSQYDVSKGLKYGEALKRSRTGKEGGAFGLAGGFNAPMLGPGARLKTEDEDVEMLDAGLDDRMTKGQVGSLLTVQTLGGRIRDPQEGDPLYMLGAFRDQNLFLSPVSAVVQLRPQLHHLDAAEEVAKGRAGRAKKEGMEEDRPEASARVIDVKVKSAEGGETTISENIELLKKMQDEQWEEYEWVDAELSVPVSRCFHIIILIRSQQTEDAWYTYENNMIHEHPEDLPQLKSAIEGEDYLDAMSAPRIDPARPEMTGWAMKQNRKKQNQNQTVADVGNG